MLHVRFAFDCVREVVTLLFWIDFVHTAESAVPKASQHTVFPKLIAYK